MTLPKKADLSFNDLWFLGIFVCLMILLSFSFFWLNLSPQRSSQRAIADVKQALATGDTRFVSVLVGTIGIPSIPDGQFNSLVLLHRYKNPIGIGDFIRTPIQARQQDAAVKYALTYNSQLLQHILSQPDGKTRRYLNQVRQQLNRLRKANPEKDALQAFKQSKGFLLVTGNRDFGYPIEDNRASWVGTQLLLINSSVLSIEERKKFDKVIHLYLIPHNKALYQLLLRKWEQQGVKKGMRPR